MSMAMVGVGLTAVSMAQAAGQASASNKINSLNLGLAQAQVKGENMDRQSGNIEKAAKGSLARFMMQENNKRLLDNAGRAEAAGKQNLVRLQDSMLSGSLEDKIAAAEAAGAYAANAAFNGTGGNAVDLIDMTMRLKQSRQQKAIEQQNGYVNYDAMAQIAGIMPQAAESMDMGDISDGMDYSQSFAGIGGGKQSVAGAALGAMLGSPFLKPALQSFGRSGQPGVGQPMSGTGLKVPGQTGNSFSFNTNPSTGLRIP